MSKNSRFIGLTVLCICSLLLVSIVSMDTAYGKDLYKIGIASFGKHPSIDACIDGFKDALKEAGYIEGQNIEYELLLAQFDMATSVAIADTLANKRKDLIFTTCTPMSQAVAKKIKRVPMVYGMVTDAVAAGIIKSEQSSGNNVTGATDRPNMSYQFKLFKKAVPNLKRLGFPYNPAEANDAVQYNTALKLAKEMGFKVVAVPVANSSEVQAGMQNLVGRVDGVYVPSSNVVNVAFAAVSKVCNEKGIPLFGSDEEAAKRGAFASMGVSYYAVGVDAGKLAVRILKGEKPSDIPSSTPKSFETRFNLKAAQKQGVTIPEDELKAAAKIIE